MPQPLPGRNPKSNVHFTNPRARRQQEEKADTLRRQEHQNRVIQRAREANERKLQAKLDAVAGDVSTKFKPVALRALERATKGVQRGKVNKRLASTIILAVHEWFKEKSAEDLRAKKVPEELVREIEQEHLQLLESAQYTEHLSNLLSSNPSVQEQREVLDAIKKWKGRIERIAEGQYL